VTTVTQNQVAVRLTRPSWTDFVLKEFAPVPGRFNGMIRMVVATAIVLITSMTLEVPVVALSLFVVLFLTKGTSVITSQNSVAVAIMGFVAVTVVTLAIGLTLLLCRFTIEYPPLRFGVMALVFFLGMFASRTLRLGAAGFLIAIVVLVSQAYVDLFPGPEPIVRAILWVWVVVAYPAAVAVGVNLLLLPTDPEPLLRQQLVARLRAAGRLLGAPRGSAEALAAANSLSAFAAQGPEQLVKLVRLAEIRDSSLAPLRFERVAKIQLVARLVDSAALLADLAAVPSVEEQARLSHLAAECERFAKAVAAGDRSVPGFLVGNGSDEAPSKLAPVIAELERVMRELPVAEGAAIDEPGKVGSVFVPDAFSNRRYAQFALKVTLAAMLCYVIYTAVDWDGIHTCMITCAVVALGSAGATIHKSALRLVGCAIGGALALITIVFLMPHMTSISSLVLLVAAVTAPAAWIAMGSERTAYLGMQIAFTFYLATLQGFGPSADVTEFRDRIVGVVFGVVVMALVFSFLWPERAGAEAVRSLATALRHMARFAAGGGDSPTERAAARYALDGADRFNRISAFEREARTPSAPNRPEHLRRLIELAQRTFLVQSVFAEHRNVVRPATDHPDAKAARAALDAAVAESLDSDADHIETGVALPPTALRAPLAALEVVRASGGEADSDAALYEALVDRVEALRQATAVAA
jgi:multidrug resistance protein MdtO